jgi:hypothetical protein
MSNWRAMPRIGPGPAQIWLAVYRLGSFGR